MREKDAVLGMVHLRVSQIDPDTYKTNGRKISELLKNASQVTQFWPIEMGLGHGKARVSVLFRAVKLLLAPQLLGFDIGRLCIANVKLRPDNCDEGWTKRELHLRITNSYSKLSRKVAHQENGFVIWDVGESHVQLPVMKRYSSALIVKLKGTVALKNGGGERAVAVIWLRDIVDGKQQTVSATLWSSNDFRRLKQNYCPLSHELEDLDTGTVKATRIGSVELDLSFVPGISQDHESHMRHAADPTLRRTWEEWTRTEYLANRKEIGKTPQSLQVEPDSEHTSGNAEADANTMERRFGGAGESDSENNDEVKQTVGHQEKLWLKHRGVMQAKPARTADWMRENVKVGAEKMKRKLELNEKVPDVETEV